MRHWVRSLLGGAAIALLVLSGSAGAEELALPEKTAASGFPPFAPDQGTTAKELEGWGQAMQALGRQHAGSDAGGNALVSAAHLLDRQIGTPERSLPVYREAFAAYPQGHPYQGVTLLHLARALQKSGDMESADDALRQLDGWQMRANPTPTARLRAQRDRATAILASEEPLVRRLVHEGMGRFAEAAALAEQMARIVPTRSAWMVAARLYLRAGAVADTLRAVDQALPLADSDEDRAYLRFWRLYAEAGLIDDRGAMVMKGDWPGDAWFRKALALLDELSGNPLAASYAIQLGSQLLEELPKPRYAEAIQAYERGLRDPEVLRRAHNAGPGAFLMAVRAAQKSGRFEDGRRLLARIRMIFGNAKIIDAHDISLREAEERQNVAETKARETEAAKPKPTVIEKGAPVGAPRIVPAGKADPGAGAVEQDTSHSSDELPIAPIALALLAMAGIAVIARNRKRS